MALINTKTGELEELDPVDMTEGLASGRYLPPPGESVLFNPDGGLVFVPKEDVRENVGRYGYRIPTPDELRKSGRDFKYNTDLMQLQAGIAGAARGATFGASDYLATKTALTSPEHLSALKEYFPGTSIAGEIAGAVGTAPFNLTPVGAVTKGALAARSAAIGQAASLLPKSAMASAIAKTAVETGGAALGGAIEGLAFGLGQSVSEAALGDADLTAEKIIANMGHGAVMGGALGGAFNLGSVALKKTLEKSRKVYQSAYEKMIGKTVVGPEATAKQGGIPGFDAAELGDDLDDAVTSQLRKEVEEDIAQAQGQPVFEPGFAVKKLAKAASATSGVPEEEIIEKFAAEMDPNRIVLTTAEKDAKAKLFGENLQEIYETGKKLTRALNKNVRPEEMKTLLADVDILKPLGQLEDVQAGLVRAVKEMSEEPELYSGRIIRRMQKLSERLERKAGQGYENSYAVYDEIRTIRQALDALQQFDKAVIKNQMDADAIFEYVSPLATQIRRGLEDQNIWGQAGARQAAFNQRFSDYLNWTKAMEKHLMTKAEVGEARPVFEIAPTKVNTMFNQVNDFRSKIPARTAINYLKSFRELLDQAEISVTNAPSSKLDVTAIKDFTGKLSDEALKAKQYVADAFGGYGFFRDLMDAAKSGGLGGMAAQIGTAFTNPDTLVRGLSKIEKYAKKTDQAMQKVKTIFEQMKPPTKGIGVIWDKMSPAERTDNYKKTIEKLKNLTDVPDYLLDQIQNATSETFEIAPKISQSTQMALVRGVSFLVSKMPQPLDKGILDTEYEPSQAEMLKFGRYVAVVENPLIVVEQLEANFVPQETVETLKTVYPALFGAVKNQVLEGLTDALASKKIKMPYQRRVMLSQFLELPLDATLKPEVIARNQEAITSTNAKEEAKEAPQPSQKGLAQVSLGSRFKTRSENILTREA